jgi:hypothetical protein
MWNASVAGSASTRLRPADRREMEHLFRSSSSSGRTATSAGTRAANVLLDTVTTPFWLHLEDDWQFFEPLPYVGLALGSSTNPTLGQCSSAPYAEGWGPEARGRHHPPHGVGTRYIEAPPSPARRRYDAFCKRRRRRINVY